MTLPTFPQLSRRPALKTRETTADPTLRDSQDNGMVQTRPRFTRRRRSFEITIEALTPADKRKLDSFVERKALFGALPFLFPDRARDPKHPQTLTVRFSKVPAYADAGNIEDEFRQTCTFSIEEM